MIAGWLPPARRLLRAVSVMLLALAWLGGCGTEPTCSDGVRNGGETDTDCGGGSCRPCGLGDWCVAASDCDTRVCGGGICRAPVPHCLDGVQDGDEVDLDCGGSCAACAVGQLCHAAADCASGYCDGDRCNALPRLQFAAHVDYSVRAGATSMVAGDLNGDGKLDLATANFEAGSMSVLLGKGDGTFQPAASYPTGTRWTAGIAAGDFNGDGKPDLAVASEGYPDLTTRYVSVFVNKGDGTFKDAVNYPANQDPASIAAGDLNGDGKLDIVVGNRISNDVSVLIGNGNGTFKAASNQPVLAARPYGVVLGDFNKDRKLDIAVTAHAAGAVVVHLGNGDGTFRAGASFATGNEPWYLLTADLNQDGEADLAVANFGSDTISVLLGKGDGAFDLTSYPSGSLPLGMAAGDLDRDGHVDLAVTNNLGNGKVNVLLGQTGSTFAEPLGWIGGAAPDDVVIGDFNGDGKPDLAVANYAGTVSILLSLR